MAAAFVQSTSFTSSGTPTSTVISLTVGTPITAGNALVLFYGWGSGSPADLLTITDTSLNSYFNVTSNAGGGDAHLMAIAPNCAAGTTTILVTLLAARGYRYIGVEEVSGLNNTSSTILDKSVITSGGSPGTSTDACKTANVTTTVNGDYLFSGIYIDNTLTMTTSAGTGYSSSNMFFGGGDAAPAATEHQVQTTATTTAGTWTLSNGQQFTVGLMALFSSSASPATTGISFYNNFQLLGVM